MKIIKKLEDIFAAAAFAEEGEFDAAKELMGDQGTPKARARYAGTADGDGYEDLTPPPLKA